MINRISLQATVDAVYALSSLKEISNNPALPGPYGRDEESALSALARRAFAEVCGELGVTPLSADSVDLAGDLHELLQAAVTDRTIATLTATTPRPQLITRLRCRLRHAPKTPTPNSRY